VSCIYCRRTILEATFAGKEHVIPRAFGGFKDSLTLIGAICDACNEYLGRELDEYLARDTHEGLLRFRFGIRPAADYRSLGRRSTLTSRIDSGRLRGAIIWYADVQGVLRPVLAPQLGFGKTKEGPFEWFPAEPRPSRQQIKLSFESGARSVELLGIGTGTGSTDNSQEIKSIIRELGLVTVTEPEQTIPVGLTPYKVRTVDTTTIGPKFWRCIAKIAFDYLARVAGSEMVLDPRFDPVRRYILHGAQFDVKCWIRGRPIEERRPGMSYEVRVGFAGDQRIPVGRVRLVSGVSYTIPLASEPVEVTPSCHLFDLDSMRAFPMINDPTEPVYDAFRVAAARGAEYELRVRLLLDRLPSLQQKAVKATAAEVAEMLMEHFASHLTEADRRTLLATIRLQDKLLHVELTGAREELSKLGYVPGPERVKKVQLPDPLTLAELSGTMETGRPLSESTDTDPGNRFGWLLQCAADGSFAQATEAFRKAIGIIDRLALLS
jgi:hypothetical protein